MSVPSDLYQINFTYSSPGIDFADSIVYSSTGVPNLGLSLQAHRDRLQANIDILDKLIAKKHTLKEIINHDTHTLFVHLPATTGCQLKTEGVLLRLDESSENEDESSDDETNNQRIGYINNITDSRRAPPLRTNADATSDDDISAVHGLINDGVGIDTIYDLFNDLIDNSDSSEDNNRSTSSDDSHYALEGAFSDEE